MCSSGYTGQNCESDYIPCDPSPCENGGSCHQLGEHDYECICPEGEYRANFLPHIAPWNLTALRTPNPAKDETFSYQHVRSPRALASFSLQPLALLCVRITSSKVTGMTAESTRLEAFPPLRPLRSVLRSYDQLQLHATPRISLFSLLCRSLPHNE